jgi:methyltransferase-like protein/cyclopropane fatty-acyl-phospholipid synthase-like methyltransferase
MSESLKEKDQITQELTKKSYDNYPYVSYPFASTHPYHLMTLAKLFGLNTEPVETARILEIGCAAGNNILPLAVSYPKAHIVGIDLSKVQIDEANKQKESLKLDNIEFHAISITDVDDTFGKFDYIICHGVFSWVPESVREKILEVCSKNLSDNGLSYISYNTLPGWNMVRSIRDMMVYHSQNFGTIQEKINQSKLLLKFVVDSLEGSKSPYAEMLRSETELLSRQQDSYLCHEHLESTNQQFYFHDFMAIANKYKLQYVSDTSISNMYLGNMPPKAVEHLKTINDIVKTEQYMDFITNRRFRSTILCHQNTSINRNLKNEDIEKFYLALNIIPEIEEKNIDFNAPEVVKFYYNNNKETNLSTSSPYMKAILYSFAENVGYNISFNKICEIANKKLGAHHLNEIRTELMNNAMTLVLQGYINISVNPSFEHNKCNMDYPQMANSLIEYQVRHTDNFWVTNEKHELIGISIFEKFMLKAMNGKDDKEQILEKLVSHVLSGEMLIHKDEVAVTEKEAIKTEISAAYDVTLKKFVQSWIIK